MPVLKRISSVVLGLFAAIAMISAFEAIGNHLHPLKAPVDPKDTQAIAELMSQMPLGAFLWLLLGYVVGSLAGGLIATYVSGRQNFVPPIVVGILLTAGGIVTLVSIPHPMWFVIVSSFCYVPFAWFGYLLMRKASV